MGDKASSPAPLDSGPAAYRFLVETPPLWAM
jgi:hypothetical protein